MCCSRPSTCRPAGCRRAMASMIRAFRPASSDSWRIRSPDGMRSASRHPRSDLLDRSANPDRQQLLAALGRGGCGIAPYSGRLQRKQLPTRSREVDALRMNGHQLRRVDDARMLADRGPALALAEQHRDLCGIGVVGVDVDDLDALSGPFGIETRRRLALRGLAAAMVGDEA